MQARDREELGIAVEVARAREVVGRDEALGGEGGAVRAAAHGDGVGGDAEVVGSLVEELHRCLS